MKDIYVKDIVEIINKYNEILKVISFKNVNSQVKDIDKIVNYISTYNDISLEDIKSKFKVEEVKKKKSNKKNQSFKDVIELANRNEFNKINGIKLKYDDFADRLDIIKFISDKNEMEFLNLTTTMDLNLLYYLISGNTVYRKISKEKLYNQIISYLKAIKQGEAFKNYSK